MSEKKEKKPLGRPPWDPTDEDRGVVVALARFGASTKEIAEYLGKSPTTINARFKKELKQARLSMAATAVNSLMRLVIGRPAKYSPDGRKLQSEIKPSVGAITFTLQNIGKDYGWTDRKELTGPNGEPLNNTPNFENLTEDEMQQLETITRKLASGTSSSSDREGEREEDDREEPEDCGGEY